ncbi:SCP2 sterol-binding domain-containing protein [Halalkalibacter okhensis]|uniref:Sterol carrier protein n=1 Tax=Halalkalibacter okhensis TaxID=333138 RepID=A0A0B0IGM8_9BACI|nr:SCP2 sterol-binding domain-containing protein [Halalkalibacter okhensis]KHF40435.1 sterol carrier protein [Halalkalibacter okhensis]
MSVMGELRELIEKVNSYPEHISDEKDRVFQFALTDAGTIQVELRDGKAYLHERQVEKPDVSLQLSEKDLSKLLADELNTTFAFMTGKVKVDGKIGLALKLQEIVRTYQTV